MRCNNSLLQHWSSGACYTENVAEPPNGTTARGPSCVRLSPAAERRESEIGKRKREKTGRWRRPSQAGCKSSSIMLGGRSKELDSTVSCDEYTASSMQVTITQEQWSDGPSIGVLGGRTHLSVLTSESE